MKNTLLAILAVGFSGMAVAQNVGVGIVLPHASAQLDISSTTRGVLIPRMTSTGINAIANPAKGLMVYDSVSNQLMVNSGSATAPNWQTIVFNSGWSLSGNSGTNPSNQFIGTTDNQPLTFRINNRSAGLVDSGTFSTFLGYGAGRNTVAPAINNTAVGYNALFSNSTGVGNAAYGNMAMSSNTLGVFNTASGNSALSHNTTGAYNTAMGNQALFANTLGGNNVAVGLDALHDNTSGDNNTAVGYESLNKNAGALADFNTGVGTFALYATSNSQYNTAIGYKAGSIYDNGYNNVFVGANTDVNGAGYYNVIAIGQGTIVGGSSVARFGNSATVSYGGWANWSNVSDGRLKKDIRENVSGLAFILKLRPITYHLALSDNTQLLRTAQASTPDERMQSAIKAKEQIVYSGFIAQEVEKAAGELGYDFSGVDKPKSDGDFYGLRYADFVVPLVKAMQEQQSTIQKQQALIEQLQKRLQVLENKIK